MELPYSWMSLSTAAWNHSSTRSNTSSIDLRVIFAMIGVYPIGRRVH